MFRLPSQKKFAPKPGGSKRSSTAPNPSAARPATSQRSQATGNAVSSTQPPEASGSQLPDSTLVPPGISQVIDARLLDRGDDTADLSQSATEVEDAVPGLSKVATQPHGTPKTGTILPTLDAIDARLIDEAPPLRTPRLSARQKENAQPSARPTRTSKSPEIAKRAAPPSVLQAAPMLPPPSSPRPKGKSALLQAAQQTDSSVAVYHRGKRAASKSGSRAGSRAPTASPAPSIPELLPNDLLPDGSAPPPEPSIAITEDVGAPPSTPLPPKRKAAAPKKKDTAPPPALATGAGGSGMPPTLGTAESVSNQADLTLASATEGMEGSEVGQRAPRIRGRKKAGTVNQPPRPARKLWTAPLTAQDVLAGPDADAEEMVIDPSLEAGPSSQPLHPRQPRKTVKAAPKRARPTREDARSDAASDADVEDGDEEGSSLSGMTSKRKRKRDNQLASYETGEAQPGDMLGEEIDAETTQMKDLLVERGGDGRISQRGFELLPWTAQRDKEKKEANLLAAEEAWKHRQVMRRQARALRNAAREAAREVARAAGDDSDEIERDEPDSGDEYEHVPERLTPPSSPEPGADAADGIETGGAEAEEGEEGEGEEPLFLPADEDGEPAEEDEALAALRRAGFTVREDDDPALDDDEEVGEFDPEQMSFDEYQALMERHEANRRQRLENAQAREVVEEDQVQMVNNASFSRKKRPRNEKWTEEETDFFYHVLGEVGENYGLMAHYFPGRTMNQVKRKGVRENKADPARVTAAIYSKKRMDVSYLRKTVAYDTDEPMDKERRFIQEVIAESERMKKEDSVASARLNGAPGAEEGDEAEVEGEIEEDEDEEDEADEQDVDEEMVAA